MPIPLCSLILLFVLFFIITNNKSNINKYYDLFTLDCVLRIYWLQGYFIKIGNNEIANIAAISDVFLMIYAVYLIMLKEINFQKQYIVLFVCFCLINFLGIALEIVFPYDGLLMPDQENGSWDDLVWGKCSMYNYFPAFTDYIKSYCLLVMFAFNVMVFKHVYDRDKFIYMFMNIIKLVKFGVYYGAFEFIVKNIIGNLNITYDISEMLLGVNELSVYKEAYMKNGLYTLQGLTREPSHYNCFLYTYVFLIMLGNQILKNNYFCKKTYGNYSLCLALFLLFFSGGFSSVWYLFVLLISYLIIKINSRRNVKLITQKSIISLISFFFLLIISICIISQNEYMYTRLKDAFAVLDYIKDADNVVGLPFLLGGTDGLGSTIARFYSTYVGLVIFIERPIFGLGYCLQQLHSFTAVILANMGILGVYSLYKILSCAKVRRFDYILVFFVFIIGGLPISTVPLGLSVHWVLFFEATAFYKMHNKEDWNN